ncbi:MAG: histone deacetylase [Acidobacteria bacterium]|nr:MAG: histone deacetylase [Acidobacteriota bacterium]RLE23555.1 MAG: histone deacetylase [Acidobacteriota bacterium]
MLFFQPKSYIVYSFEYFLGLCEKGPRSTFDCAKFRKIRNALLKEKIVHSKEILEPAPASWDDFLLVHSPEYVEKLKDPQLLGKILFLDYVSPFDTDIIEFFMWVTGGTILAMKTAYEKQVPVFNLGGGYHHAKPGKGEGFCPVNDIAIGIRRFQQEFGKKRVLVVDLDYHQGNGTALMFQDDDSCFTYSIHRDNWDTIDSKTNLDVRLPDHSDDKMYLQGLKNSLPEVMDSFQPELVVYVAGGDPHYQDTLGTFELTDKGMLERDIFVMSQAKERKCPVAILAGGGYGQESWKLYYRFIKCVMRGRCDV